MQSLGCYVWFGSAGCSLITNRSNMQPLKNATPSVCWANLSNYIFVTYEKTEHYPQASEPELHRYQMKTLLSSYRASASMAARHGEIVRGGGEVVELLLGDAATISISLRIISRGTDTHILLFASLIINVAFSLNLSAKPIFGASCETRRLAVGVIDCDCAVTAARTCGSSANEHV